MNYENNCGGALGTVYRDASPAAPRAFAEGGVFANLSRTDGLIDTLHSMVQRLESELGSVLEPENEKPSADRPGSLRAASACSLAMQIDSQNDRFANALTRFERALSRVRL